MTVDQTIPSLSSSPTRLLAGYTAEQLAARQRVKTFDGYCAAIEDDARIFHQLQRSQDEGLTRHFRKRFPEAAAAKEAYVSALDSLVKLEFAHAYVDDLLPEKIVAYRTESVSEGFRLPDRIEKATTGHQHPLRSYEIERELPFFTSGLRPLSDKFFAVQFSEPGDDIVADYRIAAESYKRISRLASTRHNELQALNHVGDPAVGALRQYLSGVGAHIFYLAEAFDADKNRFIERRDALSASKPVIAAKC